MKFIVVGANDDIHTEAAEHIAELANNIMDLCLESGAAPWQTACALVNVLAQLIRESGPDGDDMSEGRLGDVVKNLRRCTRQSRSH